MSEANSKIKFQKFNNGDLLSFIHVAKIKDICEDGISLIESNNNLQVLALTDGMGGHDSGDKATEYMHKELINQLKKLENDSFLTYGILEAIEKANQKVKDLKVGAGATLAITQIYKNHVRCFHAGDTKILVLGSRGAIKYNSVSHSPRGYALASGVVKETSDKLPPANYVSNGLGFTPLTIEVTQLIELSNNDIVFISSDYVGDILEEDELISLLTSDSFEKRAENLLQKLMELDKDYFSDDCSFQIFKVSIQ